MKELKRSKDFDRIIVEAVQGNYSFFAWQSVGGVVEKCELKIKAYRKDYNEIELELCANQDEKLNRVISGTRILNIYVPDLSVSFSSELKSVTAGNKVKISPPADYTFYERRRHERVQPAKSCYVSFEHKRFTLKKVIHDLSIGGLALILHQSEKMNVEQGKMYDVFVLEIGARKIKVKAECVKMTFIDRFKFDYLPYGGFKLAFRFNQMSKEDKDFLTAFVTQEMLMQQVLKKAN